MYKVVPLGNRLLVELEDIDEKRVDKIFLSSKHSERTRVGTVMDVGPDVTQFKVGDKILLHYLVGVIVYLYENRWLKPNYRIVTEDEIPAKIEEVPTSGS